MDNLNGNQKPPNAGLNAPIPFDDEPIPFDIDEPAAKPVPARPVPARPVPGQPVPGQPVAPQGVSHAPLSLGGPGRVAAAKPVAQRAAAPKIKVNLPPTHKTAAVVPSTDRISGIKTFFTKLHPGAIPFMDEQITDWLKANPGVRVKMTNSVVGEIQSKKTEPNIIITIWY